METLKKYLILTLLLLGAASLLNFTFTDNRREQSSEWTTSSCYQWIEFRLKKTTNEFTPKTSDEYSLEIRNNYNKQVELSFGVRETKNISKGTQGRRKIDGDHGTIIETMILVERGSDVKVLISGLQWEAKGEYIDCDKKGK